MKNYKRKSNRASIPEDIVMTAIKRVVEDGNSCNAMSKAYKIPLQSLATYCKKYKDMKETDGATTSTDIKINIGYAKCRTRSVFTKHNEDELQKYLLKCNDIYFGLSAKQVRKLAYQYATAMQIKVPPTWTKNMMAGEDWFTIFIKNHTALSIRTPEATSLARATSFNRTNVQLFFNNLKDILKCNQIIYGTWMRLEFLLCRNQIK